MKEIHILAKHCSGGVVLGFPQFETTDGVWKKDIPFEKRQNTLISISTSWNQLESGVLYSLRLPLLVFREVGNSGGVFDNGVTDLFIHEFSKDRSTKEDKKIVEEVIRKWA